MKKEFVTYWTSEKVDSWFYDKLPWTRQRFFKKEEGKVERIMVPDDITFDDLSSFSGRKTKVTIEVVD